MLVPVSAVFLRRPVESERRIQSGRRSKGIFAPAVDEIGAKLV
jgi:hypothetical protein